MRWMGQGRLRPHRALSDERASGYLVRAMRNIFGGTASFYFHFAKIPKAATWWTDWRGTRGKAGKLQGQWLLKF